MGFHSEKRYQMQLLDFRSFPSNCPVPLNILFERAWVFGRLFSFGGGNIADVNGVIIANVLNTERAIIYGAYHMIKGLCGG